MKRRNTIGVVIGFVLTSGWCVWVLIGFVGQLIPAMRIQNLSWPDNGQVFSPFPPIVAAIALSLIVLQVIAIRFRSFFAALIVGIPMLVMGLPMCLFPFGRDDGDMSFVEYCFVVAFHATFLFGGLSMLTWAHFVTKKAGARQE